MTVSNGRLLNIAHNHVNSLARFIMVYPHDNFLYTITESSRCNLHFQRNADTLIHDTIFRSCHTCGHDLSGGPTTLIKKIRMATTVFLFLEVTIRRNVSRTNLPFLGGPSVKGTQSGGYQYTNWNISTNARFVPFLFLVLLGTGLP